MPTVLFDAYHHMPPGHKIGPHITVGGYVVNVGRYFPGDLYHPNGLGALTADLSASGHELRMLHEPLTDGSLAEADILLLPNPDYPLYEGASPYRWTPDDVDAILRFLERGGGMLLLVNSFLSRPDFWEENFDIERVSGLFDRLGIKWDPNYMSDEKTIERASSGDLTVGYGQGGRVVGTALPKGFEPLLTFKGNLYGLIGRVGAGTLAVIGDAGLVSSGLMCFPGFDNARFMQGVLTKLRPKWCERPAERWALRRFAHQSAAPSAAGGLGEQRFRALRPNAAWMVDHHYRHLYWDLEHRTGADASVWKSVPLSLTGSIPARLSTSLNWIPLDSDRDGPQIKLDLSVQRATLEGIDNQSGTEIKVFGRAHGDQLAWADLADHPEVFANSGQIEQVHCLFDLRARLDGNGKPQSVRWRQGQILYARNPANDRYGYEIILSSRSGSIAPWEAS